MVTYLGSLAQLCCGEGGTLQTNITGVCGECSQCLGHTGFAPAHSVSRVYTAKAPGCSAGALSKVGPVFCTLPRSKLVRFRFSGLGWVCVLCPSQVRAAQVTRYLMNALSRWAVCLNHLSSPGHLVSQVC